MEDIAKLRSRARRQLALGRITRTDSEEVVQRLDDLEAYIINMNERGDTNL